MGHPHVNIDEETEEAETCCTIISSHSSAISVTDMKISVEQAHLWRFITSRSSSTRFAIGMIY